MTFLCEAWVTSIEQACDRLRAAAEAHVNFEPTITCERDKQGRRRWHLVINYRGRFGNEREAAIDVADG